MLSQRNFLKARDFMLTNARMIERRLFEYHFAKGTPEAVFTRSMLTEIQMVGLATEWSPTRPPQRVSHFLVLWR